MKKIIFNLFIILVFLFVFLTSGQIAKATSTLELVNTSLDAVRIEATGEPNTSVKLYFLPTGASTLTSLTLGSTDNDGNFSTLISSGGYGIPATSPVYVRIDDEQSSTMLWPSYASTISLSKDSTQIAVGQSVKVTSSSSLILSNNSAPSVASTVISGAQLTVTGLSEGVANLVLCGANAGCKTMKVTVGGDNGQTEITLSDNDVTLDYRKSTAVSIFGGSNNGFMIVSNSNTSAVSATLSSNEISLYAKEAGAAVIKVCSVEDDQNCAVLYVTALSSSESSLTFDKNNLSLIPGVSQTVVVSGGPDDNYYISSNSDSGVAVVEVADSNLTVMGGSVTGSSVVTVCSASKSGVCSRLYINNNAEVETPSDEVLAFSQNVVSVSEGEVTNVTVSGGNGDGYSITSNSHPEKATATIASGSNVIAINGDEEGDTIIEVCSVETSRVCSSIYVMVEDEALDLKFVKDEVSIVGESSAIVNITGGNNDSVIYSISNPAILTANLTNNGQTLVLRGKGQSGISKVTVCDDVENADNCATIVARCSVVVGDDGSSAGETSEDSDADSQVRSILSEAPIIHSGGASYVAQIMNRDRNQNQEREMRGKYLPDLKDGVEVSESEEDSMNYFVTYGTPTTRKLGEGERAGVLGSYKKAFGKLPTTESEWADVIKIANGRWPSQASQTALDDAKVHFRKVYLRDPDMSDAHDNAAVSVIAYGLRPSKRNTDSEKVAILSFAHIYGHNPSSSLDWDVVRAIAYSGATR